MKLFSWLRGKPPAVDTLADWRHACQRAIEAPAHADIATLRRELDRSVPPDGDIEIELEMLEALAHVCQLDQDTSRGALPVIDTQHRVVATEACHFTAPASLPDAAGETSGRMLITPTRAIFVGAGRTHTTGWHAVHDVLRVERDVALVRADRSAATRFRFNTYTDAAVAAFLARHLRDARRTRL